MLCLPKPKELLLLPAPAPKPTRDQVLREKWKYYQLAVWKGGNVFQFEKFNELAEGKLTKEDARNFTLNRMWCERHWGTLGYKDFIELA